MARLNQRSSIAPESRRAPSTPRDLSDQENQDPQMSTREKSSKHATRSIASPQSGLPTPSSDTVSETQQRKRKRGENPPVSTRTPPQEEDEIAGGDDEDEDVRQFNKYYDPDQDQDRRRQITRQSRALERQFNENRDEYLKDAGGTRLKDTILRADNVFRKIRQTNDATVDSRLLVNVSDLAYKKSVHLVLGDTSTGIDVDLFLSKCITFMRNTGSAENDAEPASSRPHRRRTHTQSSEEEDDDEGAAGVLDWALLGQHACFPYNARPPVPSFLLGPLSVQKKQRALTQRRGRQARDAAGREARPETLTREEVSQSSENTLTTICSRIRTHLQNHIKRAEDASNSAGFTQDEDLSSERVRTFFKKYRVTSTGGPSLFDYVVNPHSFGQTVENMFYISFLIKEGAVGVYPDANGLPTLLVSDTNPVNVTHTEDVKKHQAVLAIDYATWQDLVKAFNIRHPLIPHREEESATQIGSRGWYT